METTFVNVGEYRFQIIDTPRFYEDRIYSRKFTIEGNLLDCFNVSVFYDENENPLSAKAMYDPECPYDTQCPGSIPMMKTLFQHIHRLFPQINLLHFDDMLAIEWNEKTIPLYYFSIAFNGSTWYEVFFNARQKDAQQHEAYRTRINNLLHTQEYKSGLSFWEFLTYAVPYFEREEQIKELQQYYERATTLGEFFQSIPHSERFRVVGKWVSPFMRRQLQDVFSNTNWVIDLSDFTPTKNTQEYYCPGEIVCYFTDGQNLGLTIDDCFWDD